jgi:hypothetical protein
MGIIKAGQYKVSNGLPTDPIRQDLEQTGKGAPAKESPLAPRGSVKEQGRNHQVVDRVVVHQAADEAECALISL